MALSHAFNYFIAKSQMGYVSNEISTRSDRPGYSLNVVVSLCSEPTVIREYHWSCLCFFSLSTPLFPQHLMKCVMHLCAHLAQDCFNFMHGFGHFQVELPEKKIIPWIHIEKTYVMKGIHYHQSTSLLLNLFPATSSWAICKCRNVCCFLLKKTVPTRKEPCSPQSPLLQFLIMTIHVFPKSHCLL